MSLISGFPSNAKYTKELYLQNKLTDKEATKILMFTHFSNPLFILGTIGITFLNNKNLSYIIMFSHYFSNIIIGLLIRNYNKSYYKYSKISLKNAIDKMHKKRISNNKKIGTIITEAITNTINTLLLILGIVTTFLVLNSIISNNLNLSLPNKVILGSLLEITQGIKYTSMLNLNIKLKALIICAILSFGGLSVHTQIVSIISDTKIKYKPFLLARLMHSLIAIIICYILLNFYSIG